MKIIIAGMGLAGAHLAELVASEYHDVTVIDTDREKVERMTDRYSVSGVCGSAASREILEQVGADTADVVIALTDVDEVNLLCCKAARDCGTHYAAAKIESPELFKDKEYLKKEFSIDYVINPKQSMAEVIRRQMGLPVDIKAEGFFGDGGAIIRMNIEKDNGLAGKPLRDARQILGAEALIGAVCRNGKMYVPKGNFQLLEGDEISIIASRHAILDIAGKLGRIQRPARNVLIVGGGTVGQYLAEELAGTGKSVKVLDSDRQRCLELRKELPESVEVALAESINAEVLAKEGIRRADICVCLTGQDETNLIISLFAWSCGVRSVITKVKSPAFESLLNKVNINITVSPIVILADALLAFVRNIMVYNDEGNDIYTMHQIADGQGEAIEFIAYENTKNIRLPFKSTEFRTRENVLIGSLIRNNSVIIPDGDSSILPGDHVVVIAKADHGLATLDDIFI